MVAHDAQINAQYKRFLETDINDIEDLAKGSGGVINSKTSKPVAVYKDGEGEVHKFSALCPHMKGVLCWNKSEESWDCPVHGSRFSKCFRSLFPCQALYESMELCHGSDPPENCLVAQRLPNDGDADSECTTGKDGVQVMGPAKANLPPIDESGQVMQQQAVKA